MFRERQNRTTPNDQLTHFRKELSMRKRKTFGRPLDLRVYDNMSATFPDLSSSKQGDDSLTAKDYLGVLNDAIILNKNIGICGHMAQVPDVLSTAEHYTGGSFWIDIWLLPRQVESSVDFSQTSELLMQMAVIIHRVKRWKKGTKLRVMVVTDRPAGAELGEGQESPTDNIKSLLADLRVDAAIKVVQHDEDPAATRDYVKYNKVILGESKETCLILTTLPETPQDEDQAEAYLQSSTS